VSPPVSVVSGNGGARSSQRQPGQLAAAATAGQRRAREGKEEEREREGVRVCVVCVECGVRDGVRDRGSRVGLEERPGPTGPGGPVH
jgi:hypothetical protein